MRTKQGRCSTFKTAASSSAHPEHAETSTIHWRGGERGQHLERLMSVIDSASFKNSCMPNSVMQKQMWLEDAGLKRFNSSSLSLSAKTEKNQMCNVFWQEQAVRCLALNSSCSKENFLSYFKQQPNKPQHFLITEKQWSQGCCGRGHSKIQGTATLVLQNQLRSSPAVVQSGPVLTPTAWREPRWAVTSCASFEPYTSIQHNTGHASSSTYC